MLVLFWPETDDATARRNLSRLVSYIRHQLPTTGILSVRKAAIGLNYELARSDVLSFREYGNSEDKAALESALSLYRGSFLSGFNLSNNLDYERWQYREQQALEHLYLSTLAKLVAFKREEGDYQAAIRYARQYLETDTLAEDIHRQLITLYAANGDRSTALRQYEQCVVVLERELGVPPLSETRTVYEAVRDGRQLTPPQKPPEPEWATLPGLDLPLIGREAAWEKLETAYGRFRMGGVIFISGEAGVGKSRLMQDFATAQSVLTLTGNILGGSQTVPYEPLAQALRFALPLHDRWQHAQPIWLAEAARLLPGLPVHFPGLPQAIEVEPVQAQARLFEALTQLFRSLATDSPLLLCLDDVHWADESTHGWLQYVTERLKGSQICIIATYRSHEAAPLRDWRRALVRANLMADVVLDGLSETAVTALLSQVDDNVVEPERLAARIHAATGGNAFFVLETVRELIETNQLTNPPSNLPLPVTVRETILRRAGRLTPLGQQILEITAVLSPMQTFSVIHQTAGRGDMETADSLEELVAHQFLLADGDRFCFQHDLAREVVYQNISSWRQRLLHRRAANALQTSPTSGGELAAIAFHFEASGDKLQAIDFYRQAAETSTAVYAHQDAVNHLKRALTLAQKSPDEVVDLLRLYETFADRLITIADYPAAESRYKKSLALTAEDDLLAVARLEHKLASTFVRQNQPEVAEATLRRALARLETQPPLHLAEKWQSMRLNILLRLSGVLYSQQNLIAMGDLEDEIQELLTIVGTDLQKSRYFANRGRIALVHNRFQVFSEHLNSVRTALTFAEKSGKIGDIILTKFGLGFQLLWYGNYREAETYLQQSLADAKKMGEIILQNYSLTYLIILHRQQNNVERVTALLPQSVEVSQLVGDDTYIGAALANGAWLSYRQGEQSRAVEQAKAALAVWAKKAYPFQWLALWILLSIAMGRDHLPDAIDASRAMLHPKQQKLPGELEAALQMAVTTWGANDAGGTRDALETAVALAIQHGYL